MKIEDKLIKYALPYEIIGGPRFFERKEIKDILAYETNKEEKYRYYEELKKCGNPIYKKKQYWEFINVSEEYPIELLSNIV